MLYLWDRNGNYCLGFRVLGVEWHLKGFRFRVQGTLKAL